MSGFLKLNWKDAAKGLVVAVLSSVITVVLQELQTGALDWKAIGTVAISSCLAYLLKQLGTDDQGKLGGKL